MHHPGLCASSCMFMVSSKPRSLPQMFRKVFKRNFLQQQPSLLVQNVAQIVNKTCTTHFVGCLPLFGSMIIPTSVYSVRNKKRIMHSKIHPHWNLKVHSWQAAEKLKNPHISDWHCELRSISPIVTNANTDSAVYREYTSGVEKITVSWQTEEELGILVVQC